jgi:hypothetical protein
MWYLWNKIFTANFAKFIQLQELEKQSEFQSSLGIKKTTP